MEGAQLPLRSHVDSLWAFFRSPECRTTFFSALPADLQNEASSHHAVSGRPSLTRLQLTQFSVYNRWTEPDLSVLDVCNLRLSNEEYFVSRKENHLTRVLSHIF